MATKKTETKKIIPKLEGDKWEYDTETKIFTNFRRKSLKIQMTKKTVLVGALSSYEIELVKDEFKVLR